MLRGFGVGEWTNTEAYMLEWPDGNGKYLWYYGYTRIHSTLKTLMGEDAADQYWQTWDANVITEADVARWLSWGLNAVRLSINYHWFSPADGVYLDSGWQWIDQIIAWCKAYHIYVILCMHAAPGAQNPELMSDTVDGKPHLWTEPSIYQPWTFICGAPSPGEWSAIPDLTKRPTPTSEVPTIRPASPHQLRNGERRDRGCHM